MGTKQHSGVNSQAHGTTTLTANVFFNWNISVADRKYLRV